MRADERAGWGQKHALQKENRLTSTELAFRCLPCLLSHRVGRLYRTTRAHLRSVRRRVPDFRTSELTWAPCQARCHEPNNEFPRYNRRTASTGVANVSGVFREPVLWISATWARWSSQHTSPSCGTCAMMLQELSHIIIDEVQERSLDVFIAPAASYLLSSLLEVARSRGSATRSITTHSATRMGSHGLRQPRKTLQDLRNPRRVAERMYLRDPIAQVTARKEIVYQWARRHWPSPGSRSKHHCEAFRHDSGLSHAMANTSL